MRRAGRSDRTGGSRRLLARERGGSSAQMDLYSGAAVRGLFDRMSRSYERMNIATSFGFSVRWRRQMMRLLPTGSNRSRVLDAMSGMGETWTEILREIPDARPAALDFSASMTAHVETRNRDRFGGRFAVVCQDMLDNELRDSEFDVVVSAYGRSTATARGPHPRSRATPS